MEIKEITYTYYCQLLELAKYLNPKVGLNVSTIQHEKGTMYFKSLEGISYLKPNGLMGGLARFKNGTEKVAKVHQDIRIKLGGTFLECFDGKLTEIYSKQGFKVVARLKFNPDFAPNNWQNDKDLVNMPDIVFMSLDAKECLTFDSYDDALNYSAMKVNYLCRFAARVNGDKANIYQSTLYDALNLLGTRFGNIRQITPFLNCVDLHFYGMEHYIRVVRKIDI